jgi:L-alanine-DL-glutamate epimerase-like enolase superfamily enzyme
MSKIDAYKIYLVRVPYEEGRGASHIIVQLRTDDGLTGVGYFSLLAQWAVKPFHAAVEHFCQRVIGEDPLEVEAITSRFMSSGGDWVAMVSRAVSAVDVAMWDLKGKILGQPLHRLLGGYRTKVPAYAGWKLWWQYDVETVAANAAEFAKQGFKALKYRMWGDGADMTPYVERTHAIRDAVGPDFGMHLDINQNFSPDRAMRLGRALEPYNLAWLEDPVDHTNFHALSELASQLHLPIATGESLDRQWTFRTLLEHHAADYVIVDLLVGGITEWMKIAALCGAYGKKVAAHLAPEVLAHAVAGIPNGHIVEYLPWTKDIWQETPPLVDGDLVLGEAPGLGLELDEKALAHYAIA